ncbi:MULTISPECIES: response regulator [Methylobacterium]|uniref:response regulator n=1 Tax=Methylobacterium TaxID=407 RepID=UPI001FAC966F|nr:MULTISPECIES: response regulator [Methylobacterium]
MDRVSLKSVAALQAGTVAVLSAVVVWSSLALTGAPRGSGPDTAQLRRTSEAFAGSLDRSLFEVSQDLRTAAVALRQTGTGLMDADPQAVVRAWADLRPAYADILLVGANGRIRAAGREDMIGRDVSGQPWFASARNAASTVVTASATPRDPVPFEVSIPVAGSGSRNAEYLVARLADTWLGDLRSGILRARPAADSALVLTVLAPDGRALAGNGGAQAGDGGARNVEHATPSTGYGDLGPSGWLAVARTSEPRTAGIGLPDPRLCALWIATALLAAALAYAITGRLTRRLAKIMDSDGEESVPSRIAEFRVGAERLAARERSRGRALAEARTALARVRERLRTFEAMSGWTYWEIDTEAGNVTWVDSAAPGVAATDRAVALTDLTDGIKPQDRDLMRFTMQAALDGEGPHDVVLRRAESTDGQEARRLLVRFIRGSAEVSAPGAARLHALSREVPAGLATGAQDGTETADAGVKTPERRGENMLRQVIDGIVDDFNNLLTVISGNLGTLKRRHGLNPEQVRLIEAALAGAQRGSSLTRRLVRFVRRDDSTLQETEIGTALTAFAPFLSANVLSQAPIKIRVRPGLARALCSEGMLEAVLLNLAFHVRDLGSEGFAIGADERVLSEEDGIALRPGRYVRLVLASGTPGRVTPLATPPGEERSTAAVANLLSGIGGGFRLVADGRGESAFLAELWIPAGEAPGETGHEEAATVQPRLHVLLVDSDTLVRESFAEALSDLGHRVTQAGSAEHALALLDAPEGFDVMIADQRMPVMSGLQLAATVVQHHPGIRIVLAGPQGHLPESARAFLQIDKPFRYGDLAAVMRRAAHDPAAKAA